MSDTRLRELERRWKETGSPDDEAAYLLERVRVGDLTQERLELAAYCGHEGARRAARLEPTSPSLGRGPNFVSWLGGLARFGADAEVRAALAISRHFLLPIWSKGPWSTNRSPNELVDVLCAVVHAGAPAGSRVRQVADEMRAATEMASRGTGYAGVTCDIGVLWSAQVLERIPLMLSQNLPLLDVIEPFTAIARDGQFVQGAIQGELVPWALGWHDPLSPTAGA